MCCSVLQRVITVAQSAENGAVLHCGAVCCSMLQCVAVRCSALQCVAVRCNVLQCIAVCCSALQCGAVCGVVCVLCMCAVLPNPKTRNVNINGSCQRQIDFATQSYKLLIWDCSLGDTRVTHFYMRLHIYMSHVPPEVFAGGFLCVCLVLHGA